jgi:hypothetical protein
VQVAKRDHLAIRNLRPREGRVKRFSGKMPECGKDKHPISAVVTAERAGRNRDYARA